MRAIREVALAVAAGMVVSMVFIPGCAHAPRKLYPGSVSGSRRAVPEWVDSADGIPCGKGETCVVGVARCASDGPQALDASRMSGYARLASMAFPVDVAGVWKDYQTIELSGGTERSRTVISDDVRTELGGRVSGARVVDDYWAMRRVHSMTGVSDCYDGWSLMAIPTGDLENLYPRELERSAREVARIGRELKPIEAAVKAMDPVFLENISGALSVFRSAEAVLAGLQPVDDLAALTGRLVSAEATLGTRMDISLRDVAFNGDKTALASIGFSVQGRALPGLDLSVSGCGQRNYGVVTDASGIAVVPVSTASPFTQCSFAVRFTGVRGFTASVQVPPAFAGSTVGVSVRVDGYLAARLKSFTDALARVEAGRLERPRAAGGRPMLDLALVVSITTRPPVQYNGRVSLVTGTVDVSLTGYADRRQAVFLSFGRRDLRALGLDQSQLATALETQIGQAVSAALDSFGQSIGVSSVR